MQQVPAGARCLASKTYRDQTNAIQMISLSLVRPFDWQTDAWKLIPFCCGPTDIVTPLPHHKYIEYIGVYESNIKLRTYLERNFLLITYTHH